MDQLKKWEIEPLAEKWIQVSEKVLDQIKNLERAEKKDRLELVRCMRILLGALERSLVGWKQWVNNPDIMVKFSQDDLRNMNKRLSEFARSFIEFDIEATKLGAERGLKARRKTKKKKERLEAYVT